MEGINIILEYVMHLIDIIGVSILIWGFTKSTFQFILTEGFTTKRKNRFKAIQLIRCRAGLYILLALDLMIVSDLINIMLNAEDLNKLINLGVFVFIRTFIGYFLSKEIDEIHNEKQHEEVAKLN